MKLWDKFKQGLTKTRQGIWKQIHSLFRGKADEEFFDSLEETLIQGDVGLNTTMTIVEQLREIQVEKKIQDAQDLMEAFKDILQSLLPTSELEVHKDVLNIFLIIGVNGTGKTTSLAKLAYYYKEQGYKVMGAAGDTYRAAAIEQLTSWAERISFPLIAQEAGADPAAVAYDAREAARARGQDILLVDTAGRLHTKKNLMAELKKVKRVLQKDGDHLKTILVLDSTNGQNALEQGRMFNEALEIDGLILTKLDGTAKGGIVFAIARELHLPVYMIGLGEKPEDLKPFNPEFFVDNLLGEE